jgi:hypothetical protein
MSRTTCPVFFPSFWVQGFAAPKMVPITFPMVFSRMFQTFPSYYVLFISSHKLCQMFLMLFPQFPCVSHTCSLVLTSYVFAKCEILYQLWYAPTIPMCLEMSFLITSHMLCHMFSMLFPKFPYPFHVVPNCPTFSPMFLAQSPTHLAYIYVGNMEKLDQFYLETPMRVSKVILCRPINKSHYQPNTFFFNFFFGECAIFAWSKN